MRAEKVGRALGIGLRVAGRIAGERMAGQSQSSAQVSRDQQVASAGVASRATGRRAGQTSRGVARGIGGFLRPFRQVGGKIWLEVTGVFFLLPVLVFSRFIWKTRASWAHGPDHATFVLSVVIVAVFLYLGITSFWRAWRK